MTRARLRPRCPFVIQETHPRENQDEGSLDTYTVGFLIGRILVGGFFLVTGSDHFVRLRTVARYAKTKGIPTPTLGVVNFLYFPSRAKPTERIMCEKPAASPGTQANRKSTTSSTMSPELRLSNGVLGSSSE